MRTYVITYNDRENRGQYIVIFDVPNTMAALDAFEAQTGLPSSTILSLSWV